MDIWCTWQNFCCKIVMRKFHWKSIWDQKDSLTCLENDIRCHQYSWKNLQHYLLGWSQTFSHHFWNAFICCHCCSTLDISADRYHFLYSPSVQRQKFLCQKTLRIKQKVSCILPQIHNKSSFSSFDIWQIKEDKNNPTSWNRKLPSINILSDKIVRKDEEIDQLNWTCSWSLYRFRGIAKKIKEKWLFSFASGLYHSILLEQT